MNPALDAAWAVVAFLKFGGLAAILFGVLVFGWFFVRGNGRAGLGDSSAVPPSSWRGRGPLSGGMMVGAGFVLTFLAIIVANFLPGRV